MMLANHNIMNLEKTLNSLELLRPWGTCANLGEVCLIAMSHNIPDLDAYARARPGLRVHKVMIVDMSDDLPKTIRFGDCGNVPVGGLENIARFPQYEKLFVFPPPWVLSVLCQKFGKLGIDHVWLDGPWPMPFGMRKPQPDFFRNNSKSLKMVYCMLEEDADRITYAARVKAIMTGNAGYLPIAPHAEYRHPRIGPAPGDIMIDGGLSDMVDAQVEFARTVGQEGLIFGFEPIDWMAIEAGKALKAYPQYKVFAEGLANREGDARFASLRDSSHICAEEAPGNCPLCRLTTIDNVVRREKLPRVDCIKLDVEGAELSALEGAKEAISQFRPKLVICLYHKPEDMISIPLYIKSLVPEYRLHVAHSSCDFTDTILYAYVLEEK